MDAALYHKFSSRDKRGISKLFRDDLKASFLYVHWFYIFKFNLHQIVSFSGSIPSSRIS